MADGPILQPGNPTLHMSEWEFRRLYGPWNPMPPIEVLGLLDGAPFAWWIAGGWSLEADPRSPRRIHEDVDLALMTGDVEAVREHFGAFHLWETSSGSLCPLLPGEPATSGCEQMWVRRDAYSPWVIDMVLNPGEDGDWLYKRDHRVRRPVTEMARPGPDGVPYQVPEVTLLFKAGVRRVKDDADLAAVLPTLTDEARSWLRRSMELTLPGHPWLARIDAVAPA